MRQWHDDGSSRHMRLPRQRRRMITIIRITNTLRQLQRLFRRHKRDRGTSLRLCFSKQCIVK